MTSCVTISEKLPTLEEMQALVGGLIEPVYDYRGHMVCIAHEEELYKNDPELNQEATKLAGHPIYGDVFILQGNALKEWCEDGE